MLMCPYVGKGNEIQGDSGGGLDFCKRREGRLGGRKRERREKSEGYQRPSRERFK